MHAVVQLYTLDANAVAQEVGLGRRVNMVMQVSSISILVSEVFQVLLRRDVDSLQSARMVLWLKCRRKGKCTVMSYLWRGIMAAMHYL